MSKPKVGTYKTGYEEIDDAIEDLVQLTPHQGRNSDLLAELVATCTGIVLDGADRGDLKLVLGTVKELRATFSTFSPYVSVRKATVFGSARTAAHDPLYESAVQLSRKFAEEGWMVISGAGPGIMAACVEGAGPEASIGVAIELPWEPPLTIVDDPKLVLARHLFTRKIGLVKSSDAFVCMPGGFGTLDEMFEVLTLVTRGKGQIAPIYLLEVPETDFWDPLFGFCRDLVDRGYISEDELGVLRRVSDVEQVVLSAKLFYRNYHSMRYVGSDLLLRVQYEPSLSLVRTIKTDYRDILASPYVKVIKAGDRADLLPNGLFGIRFHFDRHSFGRLYQLIDTLNLSE
jgi:uncharacterized protein (TIGR00730 family)